MENKNKGDLVLVTGGAGLVGQELISQLLAKGKRFGPFSTALNCKLLSMLMWSRCIAIF